MICKNNSSNNTTAALSVGNRNNGLIKVALTVATSLLLTLTSQAAMAGSSHSFTEYARVVSVEPVYRNVTVREPQRICRPARHNNHYQHRYNNNRSHHQPAPQRYNRSHRARNNADVFVAGVIGGAIGRELSRSVTGRPDTGATIAGAVIGSAIASNVVKSNHRRSNSHAHHNQRTTQRYAPVEQNRNGRGHYRTNQAHHRRDGRHHNRTEQHCSTTVQTRTERKQNGFNVTYRYRGHHYQTHTRRHPGERLAITVTIDPQKY